jgi:hypothetical protein
MFTAGGPTPSSLPCTRLTGARGRHRRDERFVVWPSIDSWRLFGPRGDRGRRVDDDRAAAHGLAGRVDRVAGGLAFGEEQVPEGFRFGRDDAVGEQLAFAE